MFLLSRLVVEGLTKLSGEINVQGSKNSVLPILAATVLCKDECVIHNCPTLTDVGVCIKILRYLGCSVRQEAGTILVNASTLDRFDIPDDLMREMRSSIIFMGALLGRTGEAYLSLPGGCDIGNRPIDLHLKALRKMGVDITEQGGVIKCSAPNGIKGAKITLDFPSVGATENILLAAVTAKGTTVITNAAVEPEITDLCDFLNACGAKISDVGGKTLIIDGVESLTSAQHCVIPDRIAAATYMAAAAASGGEVTLRGAIASHLSAVIPVFEESGCLVVSGSDSLRLIAPQRLKNVPLIRTMPYPGFPTDAQAILMAMLCTADGTTVFVENIFENRYKHVGELVRMGASISVEGRVAIAEGVNRLYGASLHAQDLRGAAALVVAALSAEGRSIIDGICYLERGYEDMDVLLRSIGANIKKI